MKSKTLKTLIALTSVSALAFALSACTNGSNNEDDKDKDKDSKITLTESTDFAALVSEQVDENGWKSAFNNDGYTNYTAKVTGIAEIFGNTLDTHYVYNEHSATLKKGRLKTSSSDTYYTMDAEYFTGYSKSGDKYEKDQMPLSGEMGEMADWYFSYTMFCPDFTEFFSNFTYNSTSGAYVYDNLSGDTGLTSNKVLSPQGDNVYKYASIKVINGKLACLEVKVDAENSYSIYFYDFATTSVTLPEVEESEGYSYDEYIDMEATTWTNNDGALTYYIVTTENGRAKAFNIAITVTKTDGTAKITSFEILNNGSTPDRYATSMSKVLNSMRNKTLADIETILADTTTGEDATLKTGSTLSNTLCFNAAAFALANYDECVKADKTNEMEYTEHINMDATTWSRNNGEITYYIVTGENGRAKAFNIAIKVKKASGVPQITSFEILNNGSTPDRYATSMSKVFANMAGKNLNDIKAHLADETTGEDATLKTGSTLSNTLCFNAAAFALANYDECIKANKANEMTYTEFINVDSSAWTSENGEITYTIVTTANSRARSFTISIKVKKASSVPQITAFEIIVNGSNPDRYATSMSSVFANMAGKNLDDIKAHLADETTGEDATLHTGSTLSNTLCFNAAAFALANYDICITEDKMPYDNYIDYSATTWTSENDEVTYNIVTTANGRPGPFTITIKVKEVEGSVQISAFEIVTNGSTSDRYATGMSKVLQNMVGKTLADIQTVFADTTTGEDAALKTGSTQSNTLCFYAAAFALANYSALV